jgi:hypothetical protein
MRRFSPPWTVELDTIGAAAWRSIVLAAISVTLIGCKDVVRDLSRMVFQPSDFPGFTAPARRRRGRRLRSAVAICPV